MKVIRKRLDEIETMPPFTRWNEDCECVQVTFDGGETWVDSPPNDPRTGGGFRAPALTGDHQCDAAARMVSAIRAQVDAAIDATDAIALATALLAIVTAWVPGLNIIVAVFVAVAEAIIVIGALALAADFTEENYGILTCIFYDNIDENGQVSTAQLDDILADIAAEFGASVIHPVCELLFETMGQNGFSNAGALGTETGDCDNCEWCIRILFNTGDGTFYLTPARPEGSYVAGNYWRSIDYQSGSLLDISIDAIADATITSVTMKHGLNGTVPNWNGQITANGVEILAWAIPGYFALATESNTGSWDLENGQELRLAVGNGGGVGNPSSQWGAIFEIELSGEGEIPFAWDEC